jgi:hypothetical protein
MWTQKRKKIASKNYNLERRDQDQVDKENCTSLGFIGNKVFENHNFLKYYSIL